MIDGEFWIRAFCRFFSAPLLLASACASLANHWVVVAAGIGVVLAGVLTWLDWKEQAP